MKSKYQAYNPNNARILISYKDNEKPVKFEYVNKGGIFKIILISLISVWVFWVMVPFMLVKFVLETYTIYYWGWWNTGFNMIYIIFLPPIIASFLFRYNKKLILLMPTINMYCSIFPFLSQKYKSVTKLDSRVFELPLFNNIFLDYKATGEF